MSIDREDALGRLHDILEQVEELQQEAKHLVCEFFKDQYQQGDAYGAFNFVDSGNPYDVTFTSIIEDCAETFYGNS